MKPVTVITGEWTGKLCTEQKLNEFLENDGARLLYGCIYENAGYWNTENLFQDCLITAARCIEAYDEARMDTKLTTYIWHACENVIKMAYRKRGTVKVLSEENLTVPMSEDAFDVEDHTAPGLDESIGEKVDLETRIAALRKAIEASATGLTDEEKTVIYETLKDRTQFEIGRTIGRSQSYVSKTYSTALKKLRTALCGMGMGV